VALPVGASLAGLVCVDAVALYCYSATIIIIIIHHHVCKWLWLSWRSQMWLFKTGIAIDLFGTTTCCAVWPFTYFVTDSAE
jgi:hypothetical protein